MQRLWPLSIRSFRLKAGQVGTEVHQLLPPGVVEPGVVRPPFSAQSVDTKLQSVAAAHNTTNPLVIAAHYAPDGVWNFAGGTSLCGRDAVASFLRRRFETQLEWHVRMALFVSDTHRIAASAHCEWRTAREDGGWYRSVCNEQLTFDDQGLITEHDTTTNDLPIREDERLLSDSKEAFAALAEKHGLLPRSAEMPYPEG